MRAEQSPIPVFLISFNRGAMLERVAANLKNLSTPTRVVVHDNGSSDGETLHVLDRMKNDGVDVFHRQPIACAEELDRVNETVQDYFSKNPPSDYVVSDCDVDLGVADPRALLLYLEILKLFPDAQCVGPMLRIRDVPPTYPLYNLMMNSHIEQFWRHRPSWVETETAGRVAYLRSLIDTTFAVHRKGEAFRRLKRGLRVYEPFDALHLDWYTEPGATDAYARTSSPGVSHWNNAAERGKNAYTPLKYSKYYAVRAEPDGSAREVVEKVARGQAPAP